MSNRTRFPELDLLRFLAAGAVMLYHYAFRGPLIGAWPGAFPELSHFAQYGYLGVNVFFILSGFVILFTAHDKSATAFAQARIVRLYPAYWICVTLTTLGLLLAGQNSAHISPAQYFANLTMVHSYLGIGDISGVYWTLAVELKFYFLIFLVLALGQIRRLGVLLGFWLLVSLGLSRHEAHGIPGFFLFPEWSSYFIAGAMFFLIYRDGPSVYKLFIIAVCYILSAAYAVGVLPLGGAQPEPGLNPGLLVALLAIFYLLFLGIALRPRRGQVSSRFCILGLITYPLYLLHQDLGFILLRLGSGELNRWLLLGAVMGAIILLSWLVHVWPERRLASRLKSFLANSTKAAFSLRGILTRDWRSGADCPSEPAGAPIPAATPIPLSRSFVEPTGPRRPMPGPQIASAPGLSDLPES